MSDKTNPEPISLMGIKSIFDVPFEWFGQNPGLIEMGLMVSIPSCPTIRHLMGHRELAARQNTRLESGVYSNLRECHYIFQRNFFEMMEAPELTYPNLHNSLTMAEITARTKAGPSEEQRLRRILFGFAPDPENVAYLKEYEPDILYLEGADRKKVTLGAMRELILGHELAHDLFRAEVPLEEFTKISEKIRSMFMRKEPEVYIGMHDDQQAWLLATYLVFPNPLKVENGAVSFVPYVPQATRSPSIYPKTNTALRY